MFCWCCFAGPAGVRLLLQLQEFMVRPCQAILQNDTLVQVGVWARGETPMAACGLLQVMASTQTYNVPTAPSRAYTASTGAAAAAATACCCCRGRPARSNCVVWVQMQSWACPSLVATPRATAAAACCPMLWAWMPLLSTVVHCCRRHSACHR